MTVLQEGRDDQMAKGAAPEIMLTISNGSSQSHPAILLRKFFAMVFLQPGGKKLEIFIATVFGGIADATAQRDKFPLTNYDKNPGSNCYLNFDFQSDILVKDDCRVEDITESFCNQTDKVELVWCDGGAQGINEYEDEKTVAGKLKELYSELYQSEAPTVTLAPGPLSKVYEIKKGSAFTHHCMAIRGGFQLSPNNGTKYTLSVPIKVDGLEAINWIKTELTLSENILNRRIHFSIQLASGQTFYTPDFTWYFAPPPGSAVNEDTATLVLGTQGQDILNNIQNVRDDTTVLFQEWVELDIEDRRKARVQPKLLDQWQSPFAVMSQVGRIAVGFETFNPERESNHQFMVGLVVAFILSFCSDKTRINDFYACLLQTCQCTSKNGICICQSFCNAISILMPFVVLINFWVYAYNPQKCLPSSWGDRHPKKWLCLKAFWAVALFTFFTLAVYIFGVWPVFGQIVGRVISCTLNWWIICWISVVNVICCALHIGAMKFKYKRSPKY